MICLICDSEHDGHCSSGWIGKVTVLQKKLDAAIAERDEWKKLVDYIIDLPCCDSKYPGCKVCSAIDLLVHSGLKLDKFVASQATPESGEK